MSLTSFRRRFRTARTGQSRYSLYDIYILHKKGTDASVLFHLEIFCLQLSSVPADLPARWLQGALHPLQPQPHPPFFLVVIIWRRARTTARRIRQRMIISAGFMIKPFCSEGVLAS